MCMMEWEIIFVYIKPSLTQSLWGGWYENLTQVCDSSANLSCFIKLNADANENSGLKFFQVTKIKVHEKIKLCLDSSS